MNPQALTMSRLAPHRRSHAGWHHLHVPRRGRRRSSRAHEMAQHRWVMVALVSGIVAGVTAAQATGSTAGPAATSTGRHDGDGAAEMAREWEQGVAPSDS